MNMKKYVMIIAGLMALTTAISVQAMGFKFDPLGEELIAAAHSNDVKKAQSLLQQNVNVNYQDEYGNSALTRATFMGSKDVARLLINAKANPNVQTNFGSTALMLTALNNYKDVAELLINAGANLVLKNDAGQTAYDIARAHGYKELAQMLEIARKGYKLAHTHWRMGQVFGKSDMGFKFE